MINGSIWRYRKTDENAIDMLSEKANIPRLLAKVMCARNMKDAEYVRTFLSPALENLYNPFLMKDMERAVNRILLAIEKYEQITLYGDYDVDGITGVTILCDFLQSLKANVNFYIPDRLEEGYGVSKEAVEHLIKDGTKLIITVDCGITANDEVDYAKENSVDMVITDHHQCGTILPKAYAIVNPCQEDCKYPFTELAGVGVAFKLISALCFRTGMNNEYFKYLDLTAIGTVADVVTLTDENRILVKHGMDLITKTDNIGLKSLLFVSGLEGKTVGPYEIGFILGPRINAAGRTGNAAKAVEMLLTRDKDEALDIARQLNEANLLRQEIEQTIFQQADEMVKAEINLEKENIIILAREGWHQGVIGIVASRIMENYHRPCILISIDGDTGKGSGRSVEGFNLFDALSNCKAYMEKFGGHEMAAGLTINIRKLNDFKLAINRYSDGVIESDTLIPKIRIDAILDKKDLNPENVTQLELLSPFGIGNPTPVFACNNITVSEIRAVGSDLKHLKLTLCFQNTQIDAIGFNMGFAEKILKTGDKIDVAARLELNTWQSVTRIQLNLRDIKISKRIKDYYYSLDRCLDLDCNKGVENNLKENRQRDTKVILGDIKTINESKNLARVLTELLCKGRKVAVFVNSLEITEELEKLLTSLSENIKKTYSICYSSLGSNSTDLTLVINPIPKSEESFNFDTGIIAGEWVSPNCFLGVTEKILSEKKEIIRYLSRSKENSETMKIIPDRNDLAALYRHAKKNIENSGQNSRNISNLFIFARDISMVYNIPMNYIKVKKGFEILYELGIFKVTDLGSCGVNIKYNHQRTKPVDLNDSLIFTNLQKLK